MAGGFDEAYFLLYEEIDLCSRAENAEFIVYNSGDTVLS
jgi:GT2 family glycosyltransferase